MTLDEALSRFAAARVARLATVGADGRPHLVPLVFATAGATIYSAVDAKPKRSTALRRFANITANHRVCLLVDEYSDDWSALWWVRAEGDARILATETAEGTEAIGLLVDRYPQYRDNPPPGPVLAVDVDRWTSWSAAD